MSSDKPITCFDCSNLITKQDENPFCLWHKAALEETVARIDLGTTPCDGYNTSLLDKVITTSRQQGIQSSLVTQACLQKK